MRRPGIGFFTTLEAGWCFRHQALPFEWLSFEDRAVFKGEMSWLPKSVNFHPQPGKFLCSNIHRKYNYPYFSKVKIRACSTTPCPSHIWNPDHSIHKQGSSTLFKNFNDRSSEVSKSWLDYELQGAVFGAFGWLWYHWKEQKELYKMAISDFLNRIFFPRYEFLNEYIWQSRGRSKLACLTDRFGQFTFYLRELWRLITQKICKPGDFWHCRSICEWMINLLV